MRLVLISDDVTGALDSAVAFVTRGLRVICALEGAAFEEAAAHAPDVLAVSLNTRELTQAASAARLAALLGTLRAMPGGAEVILFKKIDSRLKGHIAADIALLAPLRAERLICPAIPRLGRIVADGALQGAGVAEPLPVAKTLGQPAECCIDAATEADLDAALALRDPHETLFVGAAGLAEALARKLVPDAGPAPLPVMQGPALFAIGSRDPVTVAQLAPFDIIAAPNGDVPAITPGALRVVQMTQSLPPCPPAQAAARFAVGIARALREHQTRTLMACGGETAAAILRALDARLLMVEAEAMAGVPVSRLLDGLPGLQVISKSGGFGGPDTLRALAAFCAPAADAPSSGL